jgi:hypothetical protein
MVCTYVCVYYRFSMPTYTYYIWYFCSFKLLPFSFIISPINFNSLYLSLLLFAILPYLPSSSSYFFMKSSLPNVRFYYISLSLSLSSLSLSLFLSHLKNPFFLFSVFNVGH